MKSPVVEKLKRSEVVTIVQSFLNKEALEKFAPRREMSTFYKLKAIYDDVDFWRNYQIPFKLNSLVWFLSGDGAERLQSDYKIYHYKIEPQFGNQELEEDKVGEDLSLPKRKVTKISDLFV